MNVQQHMSDEHFSEKLILRIKRETNGNNNANREIQKLNAYTVAYLISGTNTYKFILYNDDCRIVIGNYMYSMSGNIVKVYDIMKGYQQIHEHTFPNMFFILTKNKYIYKYTVHMDDPDRFLKRYNIILQILYSFSKLIRNSAAQSNNATQSIHNHTGNPIVAIAQPIYNHVGNPIVAVAQPVSNNSKKNSQNNSKKNSQNNSKKNLPNNSQQNARPTIMNRVRRVRNKVIEKTKKVFDKPRSNERIVNKIHRFIKSMSKPKSESEEDQGIHWRRQLKLNNTYEL